MTLRNRSNKYTTRNFQLGSPEAEAETTNKSRIKLQDVFEDYLEILPELETEKFIVIGRKGSGKTALGEHIYQRSQNQPNEFCEFVRKIDLDIQQIVQVGSNRGDEIQQELLFKWIILAKLLKLITSNQSVQSLAGMKELKEFVKRNAGFVDLKGFEVTESIKNQGFEINIEYLRRFLFKKKKEIGLKGEKAAFYKLLPILQDSILEILTSQEDEDNKYSIIFDDLDIGFKASNPIQLNTLTNLVRIAKDFNINVFSKANVDVKVIILIRDDIVRILKFHDSDTAKIFSSYAIQISWYEHELFKLDENLINLKRFINRRIEKNFTINNIPLFSQKGPWSSLFEENTIYYKDSSFKYIIDHTFYKPRDLILFFQPLSSFQFDIPLMPDNVKLLIGRYSSQAIDEIKNELISSLEIKDVNLLLDSLAMLISENEFTYSDLMELMQNKLPQIDPEFLIELLFNYSLIGNKDINTKMVFFKYREERSQETRIDKDLYFVMHYILRVYLKNNR